MKTFQINFLSLVLETVKEGLELLVILRWICFQVTLSGSKS